MVQYREGNLVTGGGGGADATPKVSIQKKFKRCEILQCAPLL